MKTLLRQEALTPGEPEKSVKLFEAEVPYQVGEAVMETVAELLVATEKHGPIHSAHEAYALIKEELDEFWEEVRIQGVHRSNQCMREELRQVAAMALSAMVDLRLT